MADLAAVRGESNAWAENARFWIRIIRERRDRYRTELTDPAVLEAVGDCRGLAVLDAGCGEGYLARELARRGAARVVGVDTSPTLIEAATAAAPSRQVSFKVGDIARLPVETGALDLVVANHVLNDLPDLDEPFREFARVLKARGRLVFLVLHPCFYVPRAERGSDRPADTYFTVRMGEQHFEVDGLVSPSPAAYWLRPLEAYVEALAGAGFHVVGMREPHPGQQLLATSWWHENFKQPMFLLVTAVRQDSLRGESARARPGS